MHPTNDWYRDVLSHRTTPGGPCRTYLPYRLPDGGTPNSNSGVVYVLKELGQAKDEEVEGLVKRLKLRRIPLARHPIGEEAQMLKGITSPASELRDKLVSIVNDALSQEGTATTAGSKATSAPL